jgi:alpha-glucosidase
VQAPGAGPSSWWRQAVLYEVYVRSFADLDGDGVGDLAGVVDRLPYLADLGVDAVWVTPFYASPGADQGYDISDHCRVDPALGTLVDVDALDARTHELGLRLVIDIVPNHVSDQHRWFVQARQDAPGSPSRSRFHLLPGRGPDGGLPPNGWQSIFGGPAWTRLPDGEWYLHLFDSSQPDLNWSHPEVVAAFDGILRFWLDRGVDGIRVDAAGALDKAPGYPEETTQGPSPFSDRPGVHQIYRRWRALLDEYSPPRYAVAEAWGRPEVAMAYAQPGSLDQSFTFDLLGVPWRADEIRDLVSRYLDAAADGDHLPAWIIGCHDVTRAATRWPNGRWLALLLLVLALPGSTTVYAGDELGLPEVDVPVPDRRDPTLARSDGADLGRDGARVPLPWTADPSTAHGFSPGEADSPWLPQPAGWGDLAVEGQRLRPDSSWRTVREALRRRRELWCGATTSVGWLEDTVPGILALRRGSAVCVLSTGQADTDLDAVLPGGRIVHASVPIIGRRLPPSAAVWMLAP